MTATSKVQYKFDSKDDLINYLKRQINERLDAVRDGIWGKGPNAKRVTQNLRLELIASTVVYEEMIELINSSNITVYEEHNDE